MFGGKYENGVFSVVPVRYMPFLKISLPEPTAHGLTGRSWAEHWKYSSSRSSWAFSAYEMPGLFLTLQFLPVEGLRQEVGRSQSHSSANLYKHDTSSFFPPWEVQGTCSVPLLWNVSCSFWISHIFTVFYSISVFPGVIYPTKWRILHRQASK